MINCTENTEISMIKKFVSEFWSIPTNKLSRETKLEDDLGITGDDSVEFFHMFSSEFKVDLSELDLKKYFEAEGVGIINFAWIFGKQKKHQRSLHEITLADLENTLKNGKWVEP